VGAQAPAAAFVADRVGRRTYTAERRVVRTAAVELILAVAAAAGCVVAWISARSAVSVPPILEGEPWTTQTIYSAPSVALSLLLATVAGVLAVLGVSRLRRVRQATGTE
jgi:hypothetical protein